MIVLLKRVKYILDEGQILIHSKVETVYIDRTCNVQ